MLVDATWLTLKRSKKLDSPHSMESQIFMCSRNYYTGWIDIFLRLT